MRLHDLTGTYLALAERAEEGEEVSALVAELDDALEYRATKLVQVVRGLESEAEVLREEERRLRRRREQLEQASATMREHVRTAMVAAGISKIKAPTFTISLREGPGRVVVEDAARVPEAYVRVKREIDRAGILDAYKQLGECVDGTSISHEPSLTIR